ncbi:MAG: LON peptidase substrate-binding domain-containing protein [Alphaproteobacteria bacterium]|nr:LON peptidase substrate-binding domain-containing protein [Alphaproteobacteria bacterium]
MSAFDPDFEALPGTIPVFPLSGVLLLPRGELPLNIFEPRYLNMTSDALGGERLIGMIQPTEHECQQANPPIYRTGCAGRIVNFQETDDGRYLITLKGICRFDVAEELPVTRGYRPVQADWSSYRGDMSPANGEQVDREKLVTLLRKYFEIQGISADWNAIESTTNERLITCLSMICPFEAPEKQALLEAPNLLERGKILTALVEMSVRASQQGEGARQ